MKFRNGYRKAKGGGRCCVPYCNSERRKTDNLSFHRVPSPESEQKVAKINKFGERELVNKRAEWLRALKLKDNGRNLLVCSLHFTYEDFSLPELPKKFLKKSAIPHLASQTRIQETIDSDVESIESQPPADPLSIDFIELPACSKSTHFSKAVRMEVIPRFSITNKIQETINGEAKPIESQPPADPLSIDFIDPELPACFNSTTFSKTIHTEVTPCFSITNRIQETIDDEAKPIKLESLDDCAELSAHSLSSDFMNHELLAGSNSTNYTKAVYEDLKLFDFDESSGKNYDNHDADCDNTDRTLITNLFLSDHENDACLKLTGIYEAHAQFRRSEWVAVQKLKKISRKDSPKVCIESTQPSSTDLSKASNLNDKGIQVTTAKSSATICSLIKTEKDLITMCNLKSFKTLDELVRLMNKIYPTGKRSLSTRECIVLTTAKLKLDIPFAALGVLMNCVCELTIRNLFHDTLKKLSTILQSTLTRVPKEEIQRNIRNMPLYLKKFRDTVSILECTEIKVQKPKCLKCRMKLHTHYKGELTVKFLTEVTPAGKIVHVSKAFGGRASEKCMFRHSSIAQNLKCGRDIVIADKGYLIDNECTNKGRRLIRSTFSKANEQIPENEAIHDEEVTNTRVYVERLKAHLKGFRILSNKLPWHFMHNIDDIFIVCCGLANLSHPIVAHDKFDIS